MRNHNIGSVLDFAADAGAEMLFYHLAHRCHSAPSLGASATTKENLTIGGTAGQLLTVSIGGKYVTLDVSTAITLDVDLGGALEGSGARVLYFDADGEQLSYADMKTVPAGKCRHYLVLWDGKADGTNNSFVLVAGELVDAGAAVRAPIPAMPPAVMRTFAPVASIKVNNTGGTALVLGDPNGLDLDAATVTRMSLMNVVPGALL